MFTVEEKNEKKVTWPTFSYLRIMICIFSLRYVMVLKKKKSVKIKPLITIVEFFFQDNFHIFKFHCDVE